MRDRGEARPRRPRPNRVGLRPLQRPHRAAGQPRRGRPPRGAGHLPQLGVRGAADPLRRVGVRLSRVGPDDHQRHQRQGDAAAGRRRALRRPLRHARRPPSLPRPAGRHARPPGRVALARGRRRAGAHHPAGVAHPEGGGGVRATRSSRSTGRCGWSLQSELVANEELPPRGADPRTAAVLERPLDSRGARRVGHRGGDGAPHPPQRPAGGLRHAPRHRRPGEHPPRHLQLARHLPADRRHPARGGRAAAHRQVPGLRLVEPADPTGAARPGGRRAGGGPADGLGGPAGRAARLPRRLLGRGRRRVGGRRRGAAGRAVRAVPHPAGRRAGRAAPDPRQGADRTRLRRPHVLGHRDLRAARADLHQARGGGRRAGLAQAHHAGGPGAGRRSCAWRARPSPGARSGDGSRRATGRRARPRSTSTPTSPTRWCATSTPPRIASSSTTSASTCWSGPPGCGAAWGTTTTTAASASTA